MDVGIHCHAVPTAALAVFGILALGAAPALRAQPAPNGSDFQVNTYTTGIQRGAAVASDAQRNFVVVWQSDGSNDNDDSAYSVQAQRYLASGAPLGVQFQVNTYTTGGQLRPAVAPGGAGSLIIVWESYGSSGTDVSGSSIQVRRYSSDGTPLGEELQVNSYTTSHQSAPALAADAAGNFLVVWESIGSDGSDANGYSIQAQRFDADGTLSGPQFQVNTYTTDVQFSADVAADAAGNFVVVWESYGSADPDTSGSSIQAQRYAGDGTPLGGEFQVNTVTASYQFAPAVASNATGNFLVAWGSLVCSGSDPGDCIEAQLFSGAGEPIGSEFQVNTYTYAGQSSPTVAADPNGNFVVAWRSFGSAGGDTDSLSIQAQRFDDSGGPLGSEFQVNSYTPGSQRGAAVTTDSLGNFVFAWQSSDSAGSDTDSPSIQARRFDGLFRDGFESGDAARWSDVLP